jgi:hypothetical protein
MDALTLAALTILGGTIGGFIAVFYNSFSTFRQEKALILLFSQEFMLLFKRCTMYYEQMLKGSVSFSTLYEASNTGTLEKLAEKILDYNVLKTIIKLKADFFQVIRWAHRASRQDAIDVGAQSRAVVFFMGDVTDINGSYGRTRYMDYRRNVDEVLNYLEWLDGKRNLISIIDHLRLLVVGRRQNLDDFIKMSRAELDETEKKISQLRLEEKSIWINKGKKFSDGEIQSNKYV